MLLGFVTFTVAPQVFGSKSEQDGATIFVRNSDGFSSYGHSGPAAVHGSKPLLPANCDGMDPCPWKAALFRIVNSSNVRFLNMDSNGIRADNNMVYELFADGRNATTALGDFPALWFSSAK